MARLPKDPTSGTEDTCQREVYYYDGTTPSSSTTLQQALGLLSAVQYWGAYNPNTLPTCDTTFTEMYTYGTQTSPSPAPTAKQLAATRTLQDSGVGWFPYTLTLAATFSYDNEGRMTGETYPADNSGMTTGNLSYTFDSMGRLNTMTDNIATLTLITGTSYGPANELLSITANGYLGAWGGETRSYNSLKQLTQLGSNGLSIQYNYPSTGNNGKIASQTDLVSGETVSYTYDALNRLATAATQSTFTPQWAQSYSYDGFGNLTNVTQDGTTILTAGYDANNHAGGEDANGNPGYVPVPIYGTSAAATYDVENRLVAMGSVAYYAYAPGNKRVWRGTWTGGAGNWTRGTDEITFFSVSGQKLAAYALTTVSGTGSPQFYATQTETNYYFGGKLIKNANGWVYSDRLGSNGKFYPYGIERPAATTNGTEKFTGYFRDSETGNDYAVNRYMSPGYGRFITPDPSMDNVDFANPGSWNAYAYVNGDPVNATDPDGLVTCGSLINQATGTSLSSIMTTYNSLGYLAQTIWHEAGPVDSSDLSNLEPFVTEQAYIATALMNRYYIANGELTAYTTTGGTVNPASFGGPGTSLTSIILTAAGNNQTWGIYTNGQFDAMSDLQAVLNADVSGGTQIQLQGGGSVNSECFAALTAVTAAIYAEEGALAEPAGVVLTYWGYSATPKPPATGTVTVQPIRTNGNYFYGYLAVKPPPPPVRRPRLPIRPSPPR